MDTAFYKKDTVWGHDGNGLFCIKLYKVRNGEEGLLGIEEAPVKTYYSDEEIWHVITTETNQGSDPSSVAADHRCFF